MSVWVAVNAEMKGFVGTLVKEASGAAKQGSKVVSDEFAKGGKQAGQNLADGLASQAARIEQVTAKLANARKVEAQASSKVAEAEQSLNALRDGGHATASQLAAAEEKLNTAKNKQADSAQTLARVEADLDAVRKGGQATANVLARAEDNLAKAHTDANTAADKLSTSMLKLDEAKANAAAKSKNVADAELNLMNVRDRYGANTKETAKAERELETAKKQAVSANQRVAKAEGDIRIKRADLASATDTLKSKQGTYEATLKDVARAEEQMGDEAERAGQKMRGLSQDSDVVGVSLGELAKKAGTAFTSLAGIASVGAIASVGMEFSGAVNQINNQLGLTGEAAELTGVQLREVMRGGVAGSVEEAAAAIGSLEAQFKHLGFEGEQTAAQLSDNFIGMSQTFGMEISDATQMAGQMIHFGLASDVENATDLMTSSFQRMSAEMRAELPEIVKEYGVNFANLGFSGEEAFGLLVRQSEKGKWAIDKTGDSLKEFANIAIDPGKASAFEEIGINAQDMAAKVAAGGAGAREQLEMVAQKLLGIEDPGARAAKAIELFGTPMEDLGIDQIPQFLEALAGGDYALSNFAGSSQQVADNIANSLQGRLNTLKGTLQALASEGFMLAWDYTSKFLDVLNFLKPVLVPAGVAMGALALGMTAYNIQAKIASAGGIAGVFTKLATALKSSAVGQLLLNTAMWTSPITWIVAGIAALGGALWAFFTKTETGREMWSRFTEALGAGWDWVKDKFSAGLEWISTAFDGLKSLFIDGDFTGALRQAFGVEEDSPIVGFFLNLRDTVIQVFDFMKLKLTEFGTGLQMFYQTWLVPIGSFISTIFTGAFNILGTVISTVWTSIIQPVFSFFMTTIQNLAAFFAPIFQTVLTSAFSFFGTVITNVWNGIIRPAWDVMRSAVGLVADVLTGNFSNIGNRFSELGQNIWNLVSGIFQSAWNILKSAVTNAINIAKQVIESFKQKVIEMANTARQKVADVINGFQQLPGKIQGAFANAGSWLLNAGKNIIIGLINGIRSMGSAVVDAIMERVPSAVRHLVNLSAGAVFSFASGGVIESFAGGGKRENHQAQIAPGGAWRVWAEPETGGEAYIPLSPAKRQRSTAILSQVSDHFGYVLLDPRTGKAANSNYKGNLGPQDVHRFADGGITSDDLVKFAKGQSSRGYQASLPIEGAPYIWGGQHPRWGDCSGTVSAFAAFAIGENPAPRRFATGSQASWLAGHGYKRGRGEAGDLRIGFKNGGPAGGHTSLTLPNNVNVEMGGARGNGQYGGGAAGAWDSYYNEFFYMPIAKPVELTKPEQLATLSQDTAYVMSPATMGTSQAQSEPMTPQEVAANTWSESMGNRSLAEIGFDAFAGFLGEDLSLTKKILFTPANEWFGGSSSAASTAGSGNARTSVAEANAAALHDTALTSMTPDQMAKSKQLSQMKNPQLTKQPETGSSWGAGLFAREIARKARDMDLAAAAAKIGIATALVESGSPLKMWANRAVPESLKYRHDAIGSDYDSVGLFQQRDNGAWGTVKQRMTPYDSAGLFFAKLKSFDWAAMDPGAAAQKVQVSAFPDRYGQQMGAAEKLLNATGIYDNGGFLFPGQLAFNASAKREPMAIFNDEQWATLRNLPRAAARFDMNAAWMEASTAFRGGDGGYAGLAHFMGDTPALATANTVEKIGEALDYAFASMDRSGFTRKDNTVVINIDGQEVLRQRLSEAEEKINLHTEDIHDLRKPKKVKARALTGGGVI